MTQSFELRVRYYLFFWKFITFAAVENPRSFCIVLGPGGDLLNTYARNYVKGPLQIIANETCKVPQSIQIIQNEILVRFGQPFGIELVS